MECPFDRSAEALGNIVALEHVNVTVPDQSIATLLNRNSSQSNINCALGQDAYA